MVELRNAIGVFAEADNPGSGSLQRLHIGLYVHIPSEAPMSLLLMTGSFRSVDVITRKTGSPSCSDFLPLSLYQISSAFQFMNRLNMHENRKVIKNAPRA